MMARGSWYYALKVLRRGTVELQRSIDIPQVFVDGESISATKSLVVEDFVRIDIVIIYKKRERDPDWASYLA